MVREYYTLRKWNIETQYPAEEKLKELNLHA